MNNLMKKSKTKVELEYRIKELESQLASTYHFASKEVEGLTERRLTGSGVVLQMWYCGGKQAMMPVMIKDGLSEETIKAIKADLKKSYNLSTMFKPG